MGAAVDCVVSGSGGERVVGDRGFGRRRLARAAWPDREAPVVACARAGEREVVGDGSDDEEAAAGFAERFDLHGIGRVGEGCVGGGGAEAVGGGRVAWWWVRRRR